MKHNSLILILLSILFVTPSFAQDEEESATLDQGSVSGQFDYTIEKSSTYEEYRVVRTNWLYKLKSNVLDSLANLESKIEEGESRIDSLNNHISSLNQKLEATENDLNKALTAKNSVMLLGAEIQKGKYNSIMWGIVIVLAVALGFVFLLFKRSYQLTKDMRDKYKDLENEYDAHRKRALEKEKKMARDHLNEINKLKGRE